MNRLQSINPANGQILQSYEEFSSTQIRSTIEFAQSTWNTWKRTELDERKHIFTSLRNKLLDSLDPLSNLMTNEMGKVKKEGQSEIEKCARLCEYYVNHVDEFLKSKHISTEARSSFVTAQPLGVILGIMPWNFPFWQVFRFAVPTIMAGNVVLLKHASNVSGCSLAIEQLFRESGFPEGCFQSLIISSSRVNSIIENSVIKGVSLTGSEPAGSAVAQLAGKLIKPTLLELGGSDPYIILDDADLNHAVETCKTSRLINTGQSCIGAKRILLHESIYDKFLELFQKALTKVEWGPDNRTPEIGPLARLDLRDEVHQQVQDSINAGAQLIMGGYIPEHEGAYYPPTIITNLKPEMPAYKDEIFGPVVSIIKFSSEEEAIKIANDTNFGLGSAIFTKNIEKGKYLAQYKIQAGTCFVNDFVRSDPRLPFGGIKSSGYGRELSKEGLLVFTNKKTIFIAK